MGTTETGDRLGDRIPRNVLDGKLAVITGAGGGIGREAAAVLVQMGARVVIAELDEAKGQQTCRWINGRAGREMAWSFAVDIGSAEQVDRLVRFVTTRLGEPDILIHNAAVVSIGAVEEVDPEDWDRSYRVHLRGPVLLLRAFLPGMKKRNAGTVVFVTSSGAAPWMGAYEVFKAAQVELAQTLAAELEDTGVSAYSLGPGLVRTATAREAIRTIAGYMGLTEEAFYRMNERHILDVRLAGAGLALSVLHGPRVHGSETSAIQILMDEGIPVGSEEDQQDNAEGLLPPEIRDKIHQVIQVFDEQQKGWSQRNLFERQWIRRDFHRTMGQTPEAFRSDLEALDAAMVRGTLEPRTAAERMGRLKGYYLRQKALLQSYERDLKTRQAHTEILEGWIDDLETINSFFETPSMD